MRLSVIALRSWALALVTVFALTFAGAGLPERAHAQNFCLPPGLELARLLGGRWIGQGSWDGQRWIANMRLTFAADPCRWPTLSIPNWGSAQVEPDILNEQRVTAVFHRPEGTFKVFFRVLAEGTTYWIYTIGFFVPSSGDGPLVLQEKVVHEMSLGNRQAVPFPQEDLSNN